MTALTAATLAAGIGVLTAAWLILRADDQRDRIYWAHPQLRHPLTDVERHGPTVHLIGAWPPPYAPVAAVAMMPVSPKAGTGLDYEATGEMWAILRDEVLQ
jgi:hypothetical protein